MSTPANATTEATRQEPVQSYDPQHLVGGLLEEEEPIPLLYFTSFMEAWVSASTQHVLAVMHSVILSVLSLLLDARLLLLPSLTVDLTSDQP